MVVLDLGAIMVYVRSPVEVVSKRKRELVLTLHQGMVENLVKGSLLLPKNVEKIHVQVCSLYL